MTPEISEFSYGFALTNEIIGWLPIKAAPIFPSLIEEGKAGGGYDVKFDMPGLPLFLQFKRAECMKRKTAIEIKTHKLPIDLPFHRFRITEAQKSNQHEMLRALDDGTNLVYYAAPRFDKLSEINEAWLSNDVARKSIFIRPQDIGNLGYETHHIAYDSKNAWLCSEPKSVEFLSNEDLLKQFIIKLAADPRPIRERMPEFLERITGVELNTANGTKKHALQKEEILNHQFKHIPHDSKKSQSTKKIQSRLPRDLSTEEKQLRKIADVATRVFDAQFIVVQPRFKP